MLDYNRPHYCPVYKREIDPDLCYDSLLCLNQFVKVSVLAALDSVEDIEGARKICRSCPYSDLDADAEDEEAYNGER